MRASHCAPLVQEQWRARSVKYQITVAKLPFAREIEEFTFDSTPINETLVRDLARGEFLNQQRNVVLVGGTGTGKTHISVGIARALAIVLGPMANNGSLRNGARGRFFNVVDLVNKLEAEARTGRAGRLAEHLMRLDFPPRGNDPPDHFLILVDPGPTGLSPLCPVRRTAPVPPDLGTADQDPVGGRAHYTEIPGIRPNRQTLRHRLPSGRTWICLASPAACTYGIIAHVRCGIIPLTAQRAVSLSFVVDQSDS